MIDIIFEAHGTTYDNASDLSSGWKDVDLSPLGIEQAFGLGQRYKNVQIETVFTSDLIRATRTADIAFGERTDLVIVADARLRECNYGDLNGASKDIVEPLKKEHISAPFPNGESYEDCMKRMKSFRRRKINLRKPSANRICIREFMLSVRVHFQFFLD
jgi:broad specificity phosphatase PhoE